MNQEIKTCELAKVYEEQGYYKEAFEIYSFLNRQQTSDEVQSGLKRMKKKMEESIKESGVEKNSSSEFRVSMHRERKISALLEKWLNLMILKQRLINFKKINTRLI